MEWSEFIVSILAGLAAAIPLVVKLVEYVQKAVKEKNWEKMLALVMDLMEVAETKFESGADKKGMGAGHGQGVRRQHQLRRGH